LGNTNDCHQMDESSCSTLLIWFACLIQDVVGLFSQSIEIMR
jgi:hypothetical protein